MYAWLSMWLRELAGPCVPTVDNRGSRFKYGNERTLYQSSRNTGTLTVKEPLRFCSLCVHSPTKVTLIGAVLFSLQQCHYLPLRTPELMLIYTVFIVVNKVCMSPSALGADPADTTPLCSDVAELHLHSPLRRSHSTCLH